MGKSIRAYARHRKVSHVAVLRAIKQGRVPVQPDGTIDQTRADAAWERSTDPGRAKAEAKSSHEKLRPIAEAEVGSVRETLKEQGLPAGGSVTFVQARTAHEIAKAHLARLRLQRMKGELIDRARTTAMVFRLARGGTRHLDQLAGARSRANGVRTRRGGARDAESLGDACPRSPRRTHRDQTRIPMN